MSYRLIWLFVATTVLAVVLVSFRFFSYPDTRPVKRIETAEDYLATFPSPDWSYRHEFVLPDSEMDRLTSILRERHPLVSLRKRLRIADAEQPVDIRPTREFTPAGLRSIALSQLHEESVADFIKLQGVGVSRFRNSMPYDLVIEEEDYADRLAKKQVDTEQSDEPEVILRGSQLGLPEWKDEFTFTKQGMPTLNLAEAFHRYTQREFAPSASFGYVVNVDKVAGFQSHKVRHDSDWNGSIQETRATRSTSATQLYRDKIVDWKTNQMELVGMLLHEQPRVYLSEKLPDMDELSGLDVPTRSLTEFEQEAVQQLKSSGNKVVLSATANRIRMVGAIRAQSDCLHCHSVKEDSLLGAFTYEFLRDPLVDPNELKF